MDKTSILSAPKIFDNFEPLNTPFHIIAIAAILTLVLIPNYQISSSPWSTIVVTISIVIFISIVFSLFKHPIEAKKYKLQIKFARSIGIASAILCFIIAGEEAFQFPEIFYKIYIPAIAQIIIFGFYIFVIGRTEKVKEKTINFGNTGESSVSDEKKILKRPSLLQLALITTALLVGIARNAHSGAEHYRASETKLNSFFAPTKESMREEALRIEGLDEMPDNPLDKMAALAQKFAEEQDSFLVRREERIQFTIDSLSNTYEFTLTNDVLTNRHDRIDKILFRYWMLCILIWLYYIIKTLKPGFIFGDDVD